MHSVQLKLYLFKVKYGVFFCSTQLFSFTLTVIFLFVLAQFELNSDNSLWIDPNFRIDVCGCVYFPPFYLCTMVCLPNLDINFFVTMSLSRSSSFVSLSLSLSFSLTLLLFRLLLLLLLLFFVYNLLFSLQFGNQLAQDSTVFIYSSWKVVHLPTNVKM